MPDSSQPRVLLWIESSRAYGRGCLLGVAAYCTLHGPWQLIHFEHDLGTPPPEHVTRLGVRGVISRAETPQVLDALVSLRVPVVDLRGAVTAGASAVFDTDPDGCAELAIDHFLERGLRMLAFCGYPGVDWSDRRWAAFRARAAARGLAPAVFEMQHARERADTTFSEAAGEFELASLGAWIRTLELPVAIFAANDARGRQVIAACRSNGIAVPEQAAVLGVDNDEVLCELASPPLSSIEPDTHALGFEGAAVLDRLMKGERPARRPGEVAMVAPWRVITRQSTDVTAIDDLLVSRAASHVRQRIGDVRSVEQLAAELGVSRATLERRFRTALGRSPRQEIDRVRLDRARALVLGTGYPLGRIAQLVGYSNPSRLLEAYRRRFGTTPGEARRDKA